MSKLYLNGRLCNGNARSKKTEEEINQYTLDELKQLAKDNGVPGASKLNKEALCQAILDFAKGDKPMIVGPPIVKEPVAAVPLLVKEPIVSIQPVKKNSIVEPLNHMNISGTTISSISGPVSFYYFRPTNKLSKLPLIMLFGDIHRSQDKMCDNCNCSKDKKSCCYRISDPELLKLFDTLGSSEYPVDFYTETSFIGTGEGFKNGEMEILTTRNMTSCYHHRLRGTKYDKCPTRNIRWHAGDIRRSSEKNSDKFIKKINSNNTVSEYKKTSKHYINNFYVESQIEMIISLLVEELLTEEHFVLTPFGSFDKFKKFIMLLFEQNETVGLSSLHNFASALFSMKNSAISKQVQKQSLSELKNKELWVNLYVMGLKKMFDLFSKEKIIELKRTAEESTLDSLKLDLFGLRYWNSIKSIITTSLVDLYVLARMFKQPTDGKISSLSFGYFGNYHIENMVNILSNLDIILDMKDGSKYELVKRIDYDKSNISRCLTMPPIDITDEVMKHNLAI